MSEKNAYSGLEIAIIGLACQFKNAENYREFWHHLKHGTECISYYTDEELHQANVDQSLINNSNFVKINPHISRRDYFDYKFFGFHVRDAGILSHQARLLMESVWSAFEDAGYLPFEHNGRVGVFCGANSSLDNEIHAILQQYSHLSPMESALLADKNYIATRLAYHYNFTGPAICIDTACSTSLVAIHLACQALLGGDCDLALAGGATILPNDTYGYLYQEGMIYSRDGHTRSFDAHATGTINSEGVGMVLLKPLESAIRDGDHIHGIIRSTAVNNDGRRKVGYTAPSVKAQTELIRNAQQAADIPFESICYIEAHGSGTIVGDPIEFKAIQEAFGNHFSPSCKIGSVKSNIGHAIHAAGIAGIIKVMMALQNKLLPPTLNYASPNPMLEFGRHPLSVNTQLFPLVHQETPLRACLNSLGIGGTNAHAICEEAPVRPVVVNSRSHYLLCLSAKSQSANQQQIHQLIDFIKNTPSTNLINVSYTLHTGRTHFPIRAFLVVDQELTNLDEKNFTRADTVENLPIAFILPGLGLEFYPLAKELYEQESKFREYVDNCALIIKNILPLDIREYFVDRAAFDKSTQNFSSFEKDQLITFVICYSYASLFMFWGIEPAAMLGYSFGEFVVAVLAEVMSLKDALLLIVRRGELISQTTQGGMLSVPLSKQAVLSMISNLPLSIAIDNGESCVVAGAEADIVKFEVIAKNSKLLCIRLKGQYGIHSLLMDSIVDDFSKSLSKITLQPPKRAFISCVTGVQEDKKVQSPAFWIQHLRDTMCFEKGLSELANTEYKYVIIGPQHEYSSLLKRILPKQHQQRIFACGQTNQYSENSLKSFYQQIGHLWISGTPVNWKNFYGTTTGQRVPLPTYPFDRLKVIHKKSILELMQEFINGQSHSVQTKAQQKDHTPEAEESIINETEDHADVTRELMSTSFALPTTSVETQLVALWEDFLGVRKIGIHDHFLELGGNSLKAITILAKIQTLFSIGISLNEFFKDPTIAYLAHRIDNHITCDFVPMHAITERSSLPLTSTQQLYWRLQKLFDCEFANQLQMVISRVDETKLHQAIQHCIQNNVIFSLKLNENDGHLSYTYSDDHLPSKYGIKLQKMPDHYLFSINLPAMLSDGFTINLLIKWIMEFYTNGHTLPQRVDFADYLGWSAQNSSRAANTQAKQFWGRRLSLVNGSCYNLFKIPSKEQSVCFHPQSISINISGKDARLLDQYAQKHKVSINTLFTALFSYLLKSYVHAENYVVGMVTDNREHHDTLQMPGMFRKLLPLVIPMEEKEDFSQHLHRIGTGILEALTHKNYDYEIDLMNNGNNTSLFPAYHPVIQFHETLMEDNTEDKDIHVQMHEVTINHYSFPFAIKCDIIKSNEGVQCCFSYNSALITSSQMELLLDQFIPEQLEKLVLGESSRDSTSKITPL